MEKQRNPKLIRSLLIAGALLIIFARLLDQWLLPTLKAGLDATGPFIWGFVLAYLLRFAVNPLQKLFERITKAKSGSRWARILAIAIVMLLTVGLIAAFCIIVIPQLYDNIVRLADDLPKYLEEISSWIESLAATFHIEFSANDLNIFESLLDAMGKLISQNASDIVTLAGNIVIGVAGGVFDAFITFMVAFYLLADSKRYKRLTKRALRSFTPSDKSYDELIDFVREADGVMGRYISGRLIQTLILTALACIGFAAIGMDYFLLIGLLVGLLNIIPYIGPWIAAIPALILALLDSPSTALWALIILVALQLIDNFLLGPNILGERLKVSPLWIFVGIIIGGAMFGLPGMLLGAPAVAIIGGLLEKFIDFRERTKAKSDGGSQAGSGSGSADNNKNITTEKEEKENG